MENTARLKIMAGQTLQTRSIADWDCIYTVTVLKRTPKMAYVQYFDKTARTKVYTTPEGNEYIMPFGQYAGAAVFYGQEVTDETLIIQ